MTAWRETCERELARVRASAKVDPGYLPDVRGWRRRLWWATYGVYVWAGVGAAAGVALASVVSAALL